MICPICNSTNLSNDRKRELNNYKIIRCKNCDHYFVNPMPTNEELLFFYNDNYQRNQKDFNELLSSARKSYWNFLSPYLDDNSSIIDIGAGRGQLVKILIEENYNAIGIDISKEAVDFAKSISVPVEDKEIEELIKENQKYDIITLFHYIEHVIDPVLELKRIKKLLKKNGMIFIELPHIKGLSSIIRKNKWRQLKPPEHINYFTKKSFRQLAKSTDLRIFKIFTITRDPADYPLFLKPFLKMQKIFGLGGSIRAILINND